MNLHNAGPQRAVRNVSALLLLALAAPCAAAQTLTLEGDVGLAWESRTELSQPTDQSYRDVVVEGGVAYAVGSSQEDGLDVLVTATDPVAGTTLWSTTYAGVPGLTDEGFCLTVAGGVLVVGGRRDESPNPGDQALLLGLDRATGSLLWSRVLGSLSGPFDTFHSSVTLLRTSAASGTVLALVERAYTDELTGQWMPDTVDELHSIDPLTGASLWSQWTTGLDLVEELELSPDGSRVALVGSDVEVDPFYQVTYDYVVQSRSTATGSVAWTRTLDADLMATFGSQPGGKGLAFTPSGSALVVGGICPAPQVFGLDAAGGSTLWSAGEPGLAVHALELDAAGRVVAAGVSGGLARVIGLAATTGAIDWATSGALATRVEDLAVDAATARAVIATNDGNYGDSDVWRVTAFETAGGTPAYAESLGAPDGLDDGARALAIDATTARLYAAGALQGPGDAGRATLRVLDLASGGVLGDLRYDAEAPADLLIDATQLSEDGHVVFSCGTRGLLAPLASSSQWKGGWVAANSALDGTPLWSLALDSTSSAASSAGALVEVPGAGIGTGTGMVLVGGRNDADRAHVTAVDRATGAQLWQALVDELDALWEAVVDLDVVPNSSLVLATTQSGGGTAVVALDLASGAQLWSRDLGVTDGNHPSQALVRADGTGAYLLASSYVFGGNQGDLVATAVDPLTGNVAWQRQYDWSGVQEWWDSDFLEGAALSEDGSELYLYGLTSLNGTFQYGTLWYGIDTLTGDELWSLRIPTDGPSTYLYPQTLTRSLDGAVLFGLATHVPDWGGGQFELLVQAVEAASGQELWSTTLFTGVSSSENGHAIRVARDGASVIVAAGTGGTYPDNHGLTAAFDADSGALLWTATLTGAASTDEATRAVVVLPSGREVITATQTALEPTHRDLVLQALELPTLTAVPGSLSLAAGGAQSFNLSGGVAQAGRVALLLGSASGTSPGLDLGGGALVPLNVDGYTWFTLGHAGVAPLVGTLTVLDAEGYAGAALVLPPAIDPGLAGLTLHHAWLALEPGSVTLISNPVPVELLP